MTEQRTTSEKARWLTCPNCEDGTVIIGVSYDREVGFRCLDCGEESEQDFDRQWSKYDADQYRETGELPDGEWRPCPECDEHLGETATTDDHWIVGYRCENGHFVPTDVGKERGITDASHL